MRVLFGVAFVTVFLCAACGSRKVIKPAHTGGFAEVAPSALLVWPDKTLTGKVVRANTAARFVVLNFPIGRLPALDQRMFVYHSGVRVGQVKITGPQMDDNIIADIMQGEASPGDEVRDK